MKKIKLFLLMAVVALLAACTIETESIFNANDIKKLENYVANSDYEGAIDFIKTFPETDEVNAVLLDYYKMWVESAINRRTYDVALELLPNIEAHQDYNEFLSVSVNNYAGELLKSKKMEELTLLLDKYPDIYSPGEEELITYKYELALHLYRKGSFDESEELFGELGDYRHSKGMLEIIPPLRQMQGKWKWQNNTEYSSKYLIVVGNKIHSILEVKGERHVSKFTLTYNDETLLYETASDSYHIEDEKLIEASDRLSAEPYVYDFVSLDTTVPEEFKKDHPAIGMTKAEVESSTWGKPDDINTTVTALGVSEQWVYGIGRYIYFEDGIVTAIQY